MSRFDVLVCFRTVLVLFDILNDFSSVGFGGCFFSWNMVYHLSVLIF